MKVHKVIILVVALTVYINGYSQHNMNWVFPYGFHFDFSNASLKVDTNFTSLGLEMNTTSSKYYNYAYSNKKGNLLFYSHSIDTIYGANGNIIFIADSLPQIYSNKNSFSYIIPFDNDTDFKLVLSREVELSSHLEGIAYLEQYDFKWSNGKYYCTNQSNPIVLFQKQYSIVNGAQIYTAFSHFSISPDSIIFANYSYDSLYIYLYTNNTFKVLDSAPLGVFSPSENVRLDALFHFSNTGNKFLLFIGNRISNNYFVVEGTIKNLKFNSLKTRFTNLINPFNNQRITTPWEFWFNYNDSFYYIFPDRAKIFQSNYYYYIFKVYFNDTLTHLKEYISLPANYSINFMNLAYDNKYYLHTIDPKKFQVKIFSLFDTSLVEIISRTYDSALVYNKSVFYIPINFITEPYLFLDYKIKTECRDVTFYNNSGPRFHDHNLYIEALNDTFSFKDSITIQMPKFINKSYYKVASTSSTGMLKWIEDTIRIRNIVAKFNPYVNTSCQFSSIMFDNLCEADTVGRLGYSYYWDFGDGESDSIINRKTKLNNISHKYNRSGSFLVKLIFTNGFCSDTFIYPNRINILSSTNPGFHVNNHFGCVPFNLRVSDTLDKNVIKKEYDFGNGFMELNNLKVLDTTFLLLTQGLLTIKQRITNISGCVTNFSDTIEIQDGLTKDDTVEVYYTSVIDSTTTFTTWKPLPQAQSYLINNINTTIDTFYFDHNSTPTEKSQMYYISARDTCGNQSALSNFTQSIFLKGENRNLNEFTFLEYTPYETWKNGVLEYEIEYFNTFSRSWINLTTEDGKVFNSHVNVLPDTLNFNTSNTEICYRIKAIERKGNNQISISNVVCIPVYPILFLPTAFSPNGDGLNDYYKPICAGLNSYIFEIYSRWGELIYSDSPNSQGWDGTFQGRKMEIGAYAFRLSAIGYLSSPYTNKARVVERKGTLFLTR